MSDSVYFDGAPITKRNDEEREWLYFDSAFAWEESDPSEEKEREDTDNK